MSAPLADAPPPPDLVGEPVADGSGDELEDAPPPAPLPDPFVRVELKPHADGAVLVIPAEVVAEAGLTGSVGGTVELRVKRGRVLVGPKPKVREGWGEAARRIAEAGDDRLVWPETPEEVGHTGWDW